MFQCLSIAACRRLPILVCLLALLGCGTPNGTPGTATRIGVAAPASSPAVQRPGPGTPTRPPATPTATANLPLVANPALLARLRDVQTLTIEDSWWVYGPIQEKQFSFVLRHTGGSFNGTGNYSAISYYGPKSDTTRPITIPETAILDFVTMLADAPMREGVSTPGRLASDYYPKLRIEAVTSSGTVSFSSQSQEKNHVPWQALIDGRSFIIDTPHPMAALEGLEPFLQRDKTLEALTVAIDATRAARPTATRFVPPQCRTPAVGQPTPTPVILPVPDPGAARVVPGAQPQPGEVINLVAYFGLAGSTFVSVGGNFAPFSLSDPRAIGPIITALDRESVVGNRRAGSLPEDWIGITIDVEGKPINLVYSPQQALISFGAAAQSYTTTAPPSFATLWAQLICTRPR